MTANIRSALTLLLLPTIFICLACGGSKKDDSAEILELFSEGQQLVNENELSKDLEQFKKIDTSLDLEGSDELLDRSEGKELESTPEKYTGNKTSSTPNNRVNDFEEVNETENLIKLSKANTKVGPFNLIDFSNEGPRSRIISINSDKNGNLYFAESDRIIKYNSSSEKIVSHFNTKSIFGERNEELPQISQVAILNDLELWLGFQNGELSYLDKNNKWKILSGGPKFSKSPIRVIKEDAFKNPFIGGLGLYQWDREYERFLTVSEAKGLQINSISVSSSALLLSAGFNAYKIEYPEKNLKEFFQAFKHDIPLEDIVSIKSSDNTETNLLATNQGILVLSNTAYPLKRLADGIQVRKIFPIDSTKGIVLDKSGSLHAYLGKKTFKSASFLLNAISDAHIDNSNTLFITQKIPLIYKAGLHEAYKWLISEGRKEASSEDFSKKFRNACDAHDELLKNKSFSGHISKVEINKRPHIFIKGKLSCPKGIGNIRPDGLSLIVAENEINIHKRNSVEKIKLPEKLSSESIVQIFQDSSERIFLGTKNGLFYLEDNSWKQAEKNELKEDFISGIVEDTKGNIWIASRIQNLKEETELPTDYKPLHVLTKKGWAHFGSSEGLDSFGISEIEISDDNILLASSNGFFRISPNAEVIRQGPREGFTRSIIESISKDDFGRIWMGHGYFLPGISWIRKDKLYISTKEKGLFSDRINSIGFDNKNRIWLIDTAGRVGVYSYKSLHKISHSRPYYKSRVSKKKLLN